ncbi:MAG: M16 family metallopeptidase [Candidatus Kapaibacterium sp.]
MDTLDLNRLTIEVFKLDNGLEAVLIPKPDSKSVSFDLTYKTGSVSEIKGKTGLAHLFEHLMFNKTKNLDKGEYFKMCNMAGGDCNAYTTFDWTSYVMSLPGNQLELGLWLESERMFNHILDEESFNTEKKVVTEEITQTVENQPYAKWREALSRNAYKPGSPYSHEVHGSAEDVNNAGISDAIEFFDKFYSPANACLAISGDIEPDKAVELIKKYFDKGRPGKRNIVSASEVVTNAPAYEKVEDKVPYPAVFIAYHTPGFIDDESIYASAFTHIASSGTSAPLYREMIYESEMASAADAAVDKKEHSSMMIFYAVANSRNITTDMLSEKLIQTINKVKKGSITGEVFKKSKNQLLTSAVKNLQHTSGIAEIACLEQLFNNDPNRLYTTIDKYMQLKPDDITGFANHYLRESNMIRIDVVPREG